MPVDQSLVGREFPPTAPHEVTEDRVRSFTEATAGRYDAGEPLPPTYPIVVCFDAMNDFLAAERIDLSRIVHGEQRFSYARPVRVGDVLTARLTVASLRSLGGADVIGTASEIVDADGGLVCTAKATLVHGGGAA